MKKIKKAKALLESKQKKPLSMIECFLIMSDMVEEKLDPLKRAERSQKRQLKREIKNTKRYKSKESKRSQSPKENQESKKSNVKQVEIKNLTEHNQSHLPNRSSSNRPPLSAALKHQIFLKYRGKCNRCQSATYLEIHHQTPRYKGGGNELENLELLCSFCHKRHHRLNGDPNHRSEFQKNSRRKSHNQLNSLTKNDCTWVKL